MNIDLNLSLRQGVYEGMAGAAARIVRPIPKISVSEHAEQFGRLPPESTFGSRWRNEKTPYLIEPMNCCDLRSPYSKVVVIKAVQLGWSEATLRVLHYLIDYGSGNILHVFPTASTMKKFSSLRIGPLFQETPSLRALVGPATARNSKNLKFEKKLPNGTYLMAASNSPAEARSTPAKFFIGEEPDVWPLTLGTKEGDEGSLLDVWEGRTAAQRGRKILIGGTPVHADTSLVYREYLKGDQRVFMVPCPRCGRSQTLEFDVKVAKVPGRLWWPAKQPEKVVYLCAHCEGDIFEHEKNVFLPMGRWVATATDPDPEIASFNLPGLLAPYGNPGQAWANLAKRWEQVSGSPSARRAFLNTNIGKPTERDGVTKIEGISLLSRREPYGAPSPEQMTIPGDVGALCMGVDCQENYLQLEVVGWGKANESWGIWPEIIEQRGRPRAELLNELLEKWIKRLWFHEKLGWIPIHATCIDMGYGAKNLSPFITANQHLNVYGVFGKSGERPIFSGFPRKNRHAATIYLMGVDTAKEQVYSDLATPEPGPGYSHFHFGYEQEWFDQLTSEVMIVDRSKSKPIVKWEKKGESFKNEGLDVRNYSVGAREAHCRFKKIDLDAYVDQLRTLPQASRVIKSLEDKSARQLKSFGVKKRKREDEDNY